MNLFGADQSCQDIVDSAPIGRFPYLQFCGEQKDTYFETYQATGWWASSEIVTKQSEPVSLWATFCTYRLSQKSESNALFFGTILGLISELLTFIPFPLSHYAHFLKLHGRVYVIGMVKAMFIVWFPW